MRHLYRKRYCQVVAFTFSAGAPKHDRGWPGWESGTKTPILGRQGPKNGLWDFLPAATGVIMIQKLREVSAALRAREGAY